MYGLMNHLEKNRMLDKLDKAITLCVTAPSKARAERYSQEAHELLDALADNRLLELHAMEDEDGEI